MRDKRQRRFFVTITVGDPRQVPALMGMDLDLFGERTDEAGRQIDGLVTLDDVERLIDAGFPVLVRDTDEPKRTHEYIGFEEWRKEMLADLEQQRKER